MNAERHQKAGSVGGPLPISKSRLLTRLEHGSANGETGEIPRARK